MRFLAVDLGKKRTGLAVSDETGSIATAIPHIEATDQLELVERLSALVRRMGIDRVLVGNPLKLSGEKGEESERAETIAQALHLKTNISVELLDERLTTKEANRILKELGYDSRKARELADSASAAILLQGYLDYLKR